MPEHTVIPAAARPECTSDFSYVLHLTMKIRTYLHVEQVLLSIYMPKLIRSSGAEANT